MAKSLSLFHSTAFREWPYNYGADADYLGYGAFVVEHNGNSVKVVKHNLRTISVVDLTVAEFMASYAPEFTMRPHEMAASIRRLMSFIQPTREAREVVNSHAKIIYQEQEFDMAAKKVTTKKPSVKVKTAGDFEAAVYRDVNNHTCIALTEESAGDGRVIKYIPLSADGFDVEKKSSEDFKRIYSKIQDYPVEHAARLYLEYSINLGGTEAALKELGRFTKITDQEITMATTKRAESAAKTAAKKAAKAEAAPAKKTVAKKAAAKTPVKSAAKTTAATKPTSRQAGAAAKKEKGVSAAQRFQDLIMAGKLTDDKIFETVQKEFGLDDNKRSYVRWYRNKLTKDGKNPPAAK